MRICSPKCWDGAHLGLGIVMNSLVIGAVAVAVLGAVTPASAQASPGAAPTPVLGQFAPQPCWFPTPSEAGEVQCGQVRVVEGARPIDLSIVVLKSRQSPAAPDPVVFVAGGPGSSAVRNPRRWFSDPIRDRRDLILFDARGSWGSGPFCDELAPVVLANYGADLSLNDQSVLSARAALACAKRASETGIDLGLYRTSAIADDLNAIRRALGVAQWNVFGVSFGTSVALASASLHPEGIRAIVLDSVSPADARWRAKGRENFESALARLLKACSSDAVCAREYPALKSKYERALQSLTDRPLASPDGRVVMNPQDFIMIVHRLLYGPDTIALAPFFIDRIEVRDAAVVGYLGAFLDGAVSGHAYGARWAIDCQGRGVGTRVSRADRAFPITSEYAAVCPVLGVANSDPRAVPGRIANPILVLGGEFDPITPPNVSRRVARSIDGASFVEFSAHGHGVTGSSPCARAVLRAFLDDPKSRVEASCAKEGKTSFATREDAPARLLAMRSR